MLDAAQRETGLSGPKARDLLGGFLFSGDDVEKSLNDISAVSSAASRRQSSSPRAPTC